MEQLFSQDVSVVALLGAFIVGLLTKRFVPWWVYEEALKKLREYEETAPELIDEMQKMMAILEDPKTIERLNIVAPQVKTVDVVTTGRLPQDSPKSETLTHISRRNRYVRVRERRSDE